jgi:hypothetical protein
MESVMNRPSLIDQKDPTIVYYGPHECDECGQMIVRAALERGGQKFDVPEVSFLYPNTLWSPHVCDPILVANRPKVGLCATVPGSGLEPVPSPTKLP